MIRMVVCIKHVPDPTAETKFADDLTLDREAVDGELSELDEYAVEQALRIVESGTQAEITYLTMGPDDAADALRKALAMGGDKGVHLVDDALHGSDAVGTSLVLAKALEHIGFDVVMCGMGSTDATMSVVPAMLAERLGVPQLTLASEVSIDGDTVRIRRDGDLETVTAEAPLPAVVSVTDRIGEARVPSLKGIMAGKRKPIDELSLSDLGVDASEVGLDAAWTAVEAATRTPPRQAGTVVIDEGDGAARIAEFLVERRFL